MFFKKNMQNNSAPVILRSVAPPTDLPVGEAKVPTAKPQVAVFVTHGVGQQIPFETLDAAAEGIARAAERKNGSSVSGIRARTVLIAGVKTQRAEFDVKNNAGQEIEVHVYEGYWSPFTEGQVNIRDVIGLLLRGGMNGLRNCFSSFKRWIFGDVVDFGRRPAAVIPLLAALGVVLSLVVLNLLIAAVASEKFFQGNAASAAQIDTRLSALTSVVAIFVFASLIVGVGLGLLNLRKWTARPSQSLIWAIATAFVQLLFWLWVLATIASGVLLVLIRLDWVAPEHFDYKALSKHWVVIWGGLVIVSWGVRNLMVQYVGDVAAYVSSHTLDRFNDIRIRIKKAVFDYVKALYASDQYDRILLVGHSLGSVITYDILNALLNEDELNGRKLHVLERTKLLLTFGSPLDKTAFLFASQWGKTTATREALAASLQPLISEYSPFRDIPWVNVHSPRDIICGDLEFYDDKDHSSYSTRRIQNISDPDALIPLVAHNEYWHNPTLFDELYKKL